MGFFTVFLSFLFSAVVALKLYIKYHTNSCKSPVCLVGKTAIVTGANIGIGYETALDYAKRGAKVILACCNQQEAEEARDRIIEETQNDKVFVRIIDLLSFDSVRKFAKEINGSEERLDILVNNAGVYELEEKASVDGHPLRMQVNYYSPFLLTLLLINLLQKSKPSRVVNVASIAAKCVFRLDVDQIDKFSSNRYKNTKMCNILFTVELAKKLKGTGITTYSLNPGFSDSNLFYNLSGIKKVIYSIIIKLFAKTCEEGAQTSIYCSVTKGIEKYSGEHFDSCQKVDPYPLAKDSELAKKLWMKTEEVVGLKC